MTQQTQTKQLPNGWKEEKFESNDFKILGSGIENFEGEKDYLSTESIQGTKIKKIEAKISYKKRHSRANMQPILNSVWFAKMKNTLKVYSFDESNKDEIERFILSTGFAGITSKSCITKYLKYFFLSLEFNIEKDNLSTGSTQMAINNEGIGRIKITFPESKEQQQLIVSEIETQFSRLDESVKVLKSVKEKLEVYKKVVLKSAFEGELTQQIIFDKVKLLKDIEIYNNNKEGQDKTRRLPKIDFKDLKYIPLEWIYLEAHKLCSSVRDGTHDTPKYVEEGYPLITSKNLKKGMLDFSKIDYINQEDYKEVNKRSKVDKGDILFAMIGTIGHPVEIREEPNFAIKNVGLFKNLEEKFILTSYLKYWLDSPIYFNILESKKLIKGTTQKFIDLGTLRASPVPYCSKSEQQKIVQEIESKFSIIDKVEEVVNQSLIKAERLRKSILKSAFEGRLIKFEEME